MLNIESDKIVSSATLSGRRTRSPSFAYRHLEEGLVEIEPYAERYAHQRSGCRAWPP
jgi:hypothetical protein